MIDEDHQRTGFPGDPADQLAEVAGLLVGEARRRLVEQYQSWFTDHRTRHFDEATLCGAQAADTLVGLPLEPDEGDRVHHVLLASDPRAAGVLVDEPDVVEHGQVGDRLLGLERAPDSPTGPLEVGHGQQVGAEGLHPSRRPAGRNR